MDVFPSLETTNNILVKLVAAFNRVDETIDSLRDVTDNIDTLPVDVDDIEQIVENFRFSRVFPIVGMAILVPCITVLLFSIGPYLCTMISLLSS